jgi:nicotinate phosphoribosyltransferase
MDNNVISGGPNQDVVNVLLTDSYQIMMIYAHWKNGRHNTRSVFDLYFRKSPFDLDVLIFYIISSQ